MESQNQIKLVLSDADALTGISDILAQGEVRHRTDLARKLCDDHGFHDARGRAQLSGCLKALNELSASGHFELPAARSRPGVGTPRRLSAPVPLPTGLPDTAGAVQELRLVLVSNDQQRCLWNELMHEHPCGPGPLVGCQLRYLIGSAHGWLGGFGFSAAALNLRDRDAWIGWDNEARQAQLHRVLGMSRFLLRPQGCRNLASHVLGQVIKRVADDFEGRFGYRPCLLESFVDTAMFDGACYRAANFERVGATCGRGREDRRHERNKTIKDIYVYPLQSDFRQRLGVVSFRWSPLAVGEGLDSEHWATQEFGDAPLGDKRLSQRLVSSAALLATQPGRSFTAVAQSDVAAIKGHYRLIDRPETDADIVTMDAILAPHQERTCQRMANEAHVLCIADGTTLNYNGLSRCTGLGDVGSNQTGARSRGIQMHTTLAVNGDGIPLGIVDVRCRMPQEDAPENTPSTPLEQKRSYDWVAGLQSCVELSAQLPDTRITCVMDREGDFFELFDAHREQAGVDLLIRARHNRNTADGKLFDRLRAGKVRGTVQLEVKRQSARPKRSRQKARPARTRRIADLDLRYEQVEFAAPKKLKHKGSVKLWVVHAQETKPPAGVKPLQWCLLTSREITDASDAQQCLVDYALRWRIEEWHRVLKTGCRVEELAHQGVERLERAIAINLVIAWRLMVLVLLGREVPELPAEIMFSDIELLVLSAWARTVRAKPPSTLGAAAVLVARIGGYTNRNKDSPPGHEVMWYGYQFLSSMCQGYDLCLGTISATDEATALPER